MDTTTSEPENNNASATNDARHAPGGGGNDINKEIAAVKGDAVFSTSPSAEETGASSYGQKLALLTGHPGVEEPKGNNAKEPAGPLNEQEKKVLKTYEEIIQQAKLGIMVAFFQIIAVFYRIKTEFLYRETHPSFEAYFNDKWGYGRSHAYRLADAGEIYLREKASPRGDTIKLLDSEAHYRPFVKRTVEEQDAVIDLLGRWVNMSGRQEVTPRMVESAVAVLHPPAGAAEQDERKNALVTKFETAVDDIKKQLPAGTPKDVRRLLDQLKKKTAALGNPTRKTGIDCTDATWNPLQGCSGVSAGCDNCCAAKLVATRLADVYPGLASEVKKDGKKTYIFNNVIRLLPDQLGDPLQDRIPGRYVVNSMSDLFHDKVPDEFIEAVFDVMEKAHWHEFQVLTKRPKRMAEFTERYFKDKTPPAHIWLGTSTENQAALDERLPELLKVKTAVRWLSCEPLIGPIEFDSLDDIDWVVVGGESGSKRKMEVAWVTGIRDACAEAGVPFFFKQWADYGEDGKRIKKPKKDGLTPPALEGVIHNAYPGDQPAKPAKPAKPTVKRRGRPKKAELQTAASEPATGPTANAPVE